MRTKQLLTKTLLLLAVMLMGAGTAWADTVTTIATATFDGKNGNYTEGWTTTGTGVGRTDCVIIGYGENITSPAFDLSEYSSISITFTGRRYGSLSGSKATVDASIGGSSVGTIDITKSSVQAVDGSITFTPTSSMTNAVLVFTCTNATSAGSTHGAGIGSITITGTKASNAALTGITLSGDYETTFPQNGTFSYEGLIVTASYDDGTSSVVTGFTVSSPDMTTLGTQTVTVSYTEGDVTKTASYDITIEEAHDYATLPFSWAGGSSADLKKVLGVTVNCDGSDYSSTNNPYLVKFSKNGHYVMVKTDSRPGKVTVGVKMLGGSDATSITVQGSANGETFTDVQTLTISGAKNDILNLETTNSFAATDRYVRLYFNKGSGSNVGVGPISIALPSTDPEISANATLSLAFDATSGEIGYSIINPVDGVSLTATTEADWISDFVVADEKVTFTTTANTGAERIATITLAYGTLTKNVSVTQAAAPVVYTTIPEIFAAAKSTAMDVNVTFNNWVVSGVTSDGKTAYVTDNNGNGFIIYTSNHGFKVNDKLTGTVSGTPLKLYNGSAEFTDLTASTTGLTVNNDGAITIITDKAIADLGGVNTGAVISLSNLTYDGTNLSDGTNTIKPYSNLFSGTFESGKTYHVTGVYLQYNSTKEIMPRSAEDIEEVVSKKPSITVDPVTVAVDADEHDGTLALTYVNLTISGMTDFDIQYYDAEGEETTEPDWIGVEVAEQDPQVGEGYVVSYVIGANDGDARTAYMKVYALDDNAENVYSDLITITQAKYVAPEAAASVTFDFTDTAWGFPADYSKDTKQYTNGSYTITLGASESGHKAMTSNSKQTALLFGKKDATLSLPAFDFNVSKIKVYGNSSASSKVTFNVFVDDDEVSTEVTSSAENHDFEIATENQSAGTIYTIKLTNANNAQFSKIEIFGYVNAIVTAAGYATYCSENALDFKDVEGLTAYRATISDEQVNFTKVEQVPAGEGVLLKGTKGVEGVYNIPVIESAKEIENDFIGVTETKKIEETGIFVLLNGDEGVGFYKTTTAFTVGANTAYLPALAGGEGSRTFIGFDFSDATAIEGVAAEKMANGEVYNLQGQRVDSSMFNGQSSMLKKGLYIMNGKKVMIK